MKILVADDSKTNLALIKAALEKLGHTVIAVNSGEEAINEYELNHPDLIILDVMMENMNGFECAKKIRALHYDVWIPIIFLSANVDDESIKQGIDAGGDDYLTKPCSDITLAAKIKAMQRIADMRTKLIDTTRKLAVLSSTDPLTGVYNRFQFDKSLLEKTYAAERYDHVMGLLFIDLDNFKLINDTFGHNIGDLLLKETTNRLRACLCIDDFIARIGGDEFSVIISQVESIESVGAVAQKMLEAMAPDFYLDGHHVRIGASIGIACYPCPGTSKDNLIKHADIAMYHAKSLGRNNYQYYNDDLNDRYKKQIDLEYALKFALERNEMQLNYQPIYDISGEQVKLHGLEVLMAWQHPKFGIIPPNIFIPIAEETGLIQTLGNWVMRKACEQARDWPLKNIKDFKLAINVSPYQLLQNDFIQMIIDILKFNDFSPNILELEITETNIMGYYTDAFKDTIQNLHRLGVSIAIDDFGTAYSSLTRLKILEIDTLKIDKIFVQDVLTNQNSGIIINCLIALGANLGVKVIAEGIETSEQLRFLKDKGCQYGQGYYFSQAISADKMLEFFKTHEQSIK